MVQNEVGIQKPVMGWDTETYEGRCKLLANSSNEFLYPSSFDDILKFFIDQSVNRHINMFFNLRYDIQSLLTYLPIENLVDLHTLGETTYENTRLQYIPRKRFRFRHNNLWYSFYDIFQFYYSSLNYASLKYLGKTKQDMSYDDLNNLEFWDTHKQEILDYCIYDA